MTDDRIGRSMKKCVNIAAATSSVRRLGAAARRGRAGVAAGRRHDLHRLARHHLEHAVDDDAVAGVQAAARSTMSLSPT